jgi:Tol biopolymer transport system component
LASVGEGGFDLAISHRGNRLAYSRRIFDINIWRLEVAGPNAKTAVPTMFISTTQIDTSPQFSPDGKKIAFASNRSGSFEIWVCDSDGSNAMKLTSFGGPSVTTPRWSPDGERLTFDSTAEGQFDIYTIEANGGKPHRLTTDPANDGDPSWSHDGRWIYFDSNRTGEAQVWKVPVTGGAQIQVTKKGGFGPLESPDGKLLYYTKGYTATSAWKIPVGGGEETQVLESLSSYNNMAVVQDGIYFIPARGDAKTSSIQFFNFAIGKTKTIASLEKPANGGLTVSPDGRSILYTQLDQSGSDLMLVENFH